jgi:hypothetical protein
MNPKLPVLLFLIAACITVTAQKKDYGITLAINQSNVAGNGMAAKYQTGFEGGAFATLHMTKKISLQPEVLFNLLKINRSNSFSTYYVDGNNSAAATAFNLAYLSVPVLVNYTLSDKITVNAGPQFNVLVYSNENLMYNTKAFKKTDAGIRAGLQFHPSPAVGLFASYYYGIQNINAIDDRYQWKNRQFQIGVNVAIFTGK